MIDRDAGRLANEGKEGLAIRDNQAKIEEDQAAIGKSEGLVDQEWKRFASDAQAALDGLSNAAGRAGNNLGAFADQLGLTREINRFAEDLERFIDDPVRALFGDTLGKAWERLSKVPDTPASMPEDRERALDAFINGPVLPRRPGSPAFLRRPSSLDRFVSTDVAVLTGKVKHALADDHSSAASEAMGGYQATMQAELNETVGIVQSEVQRMRSALNFTAGPTIRPTFAPAGGASSGSGLPPAAGDGKRASLAPAKPVSVTQHISAPNSRVAARAAQREQNRAIRLAQWNALGDMGLA